MILVTWNCAGALRNKFSALQELQPDLLVIQECEDPARSKSAAYREWAGNYLWVGTDKNRGLGVFANADISIEPAALDAEGLESFLPCRVNNSILLVAVWTKRSQSHDFRYIGQLWKYVELHRRLLRTSTSMIVGDFNSNVIWDRRHAKATHTDVVRNLSDVGLESVYHMARSVAQGGEGEPTFFLQRNREKPYHIDYAFLPAKWIPSCAVSLGQPDRWLSLSDHMPLRVEIGIGS